MRREATRRLMATVMERWRTSTETPAAFAARHGISRTKLLYWRQRLDAEATSRDRPLTFAPVRVVDSPAEAGAIEVILVGGERLVIRDGVSASLLQTVLAVLRTPC